MKLPLEDHLPYAVLALTVLALFYGIYFSKMLAQKQRGIQTRQIGRRKEKSIHTVELLMSAATLGAPIAQLLSIAFGWSHLPANARFTGFCTGMLGDAIFLLSVLCIVLPSGCFLSAYHRLLLANEQYHRKQEIATGKNGIFAGK